MSGRVPGEQRIFSLVLALVVSPEGLTKRELLASVHGYSDRFGDADAQIALDRQFERDKDLLRELGICIETLDSPEAPGDNRLTRYRISKEQLEFPDDLGFDDRELMLLRLAALAWREGSLSAESRRAAMKLEALGAGLDVRQLGVAPNLGTAEPAAAPLQRAVEARREVRFDYTVPGRHRPLERRVAPLRLHRVDGRWHLIAWDLDRRADRVFLLSRIAGPVRVGSGEYDASLLGRIGPALERLEQLGRRRVATLRVRRGSVAEARLVSRAGSGESTGTAESTGTVEGVRSPEGASDERPGTRGAGEHARRQPAEAWTTLAIGVLDPPLFAEELIGYGADVAVDAPAELREAVANGLRRIAAAHADAPAATDSEDRGNDG